MRIVITGHNKGLGKSLSQVFESEENTIIGFSRTNNCDINDKKDRIKVLKELETADMFINNAYDTVGQTELLRDAIKLWDGAD